MAVAGAAEAQPAGGPPLMPTLNTGPVPLAPGLPPGLAALPGAGRRPPPLAERTASGLTKRAPRNPAATAAMPQGELLDALSRHTATPPGPMGLSPAAPPLPPLPSRTPGSTDPGPLPNRRGQGAGRRTPPASPGQVGDVGGPARTPMPAAGPGGPLAPRGGPLAPPTGPADPRSPFAPGTGPAPDPGRAPLTPRSRGASAPRGGGFAPAPGDTGLGGGFTPASPTPPPAEPAAPARGAGDRDGAGRSSDSPWAALGRLPGADAGARRPSGPRPAPSPGAGTGRSGLTTGGLARRVPGANLPPAGPFTIKRGGSDAPAGPARADAPQVPAAVRPRREAPAGRERLHAAHQLHARGPAGPRRNRRHPAPGPAGRRGARPVVMPGPAPWRGVAGPATT